MTPDEAADLAARTLAAISGVPHHLLKAHVIADRERIASDLAGLRDHGGLAGYCACCSTPPHNCPDARRYAGGLRRTARLYGVEL